MSKQEKLAAFLRAFGYWHGSRMSMVPVSQAWGEYLNTPDDPPQPPEMPECVRELCELAEDSDASVRQLQDAAKAVRAYYRQPLKLEVGKVYEDGAGDVVDIVWHNQKMPNRFVGVVRQTGEPLRYSKDGICCDGPTIHNLIREVTQ